MNSLSLPSLIVAILAIIVIHRIYLRYQEYQVGAFYIVLECGTNRTLVRQVVR